MPGSMMVSSRWCTWWCPRQSGGSITRGPSEGSVSTSPQTQRFEVRMASRGSWGPPCLRTFHPRSPQDPEMAEDLLGGTSSLSAGCPATIGFGPCQVAGIRSGGRGVRPIAGDPAAKNPAMPPPTTTISVSNPTLMLSFSVFGEVLVKPNSRIR